VLWVFETYLPSIFVPLSVELWLFIGVQVPYVHSVSSPSFIYAYNSTYPQDFRQNYKKRLEVVMWGSNCILQIILCEGSNFQYYLASPALLYREIS
jgi:hypothetical protein